MQTNLILPDALLPFPSSVPRSRKERRQARLLQEEYRQVFAEAAAVHREFTAAQSNFNHLCHPISIDACIYQIRSAQCRYETLLEQLQGIKRRLENPEAFSQK